MPKKKARTSQTDVSVAVEEIRLSASQTVAGIDDILYHIFLWLDLDDLAQVVCVSRAFFDPAARWLWCQLEDDDFSACLRLLPSAVQYLEDYDRTTDVITLLPERRFHTFDLERWMVYVPCVRSIKLFEYFTPSEGELLTLQALVDFLPAAVLFPNLRELCITYSLPRMLLLKTLLVPSLRSVALHGVQSKVSAAHYIADPLVFTIDPDTPSLPFQIFEPETDIMVNFLDVLPERSPSLTELEVTGLYQGNMTNDRCVAALARCLQALLGLERLYLDNLGCSRPVFTSVAGLKSLRKLLVEPTNDPEGVMRDDVDSLDSLSHYSWEEQFSPIDAQSSVCRLETLYLILCRSPEFVRRLLWHFRPSLQLLGIRVAFSDQDEASSLLACIADICPNLTEFAFVVRGSVPADLWSGLHELRKLDLEEFALVVADCKNISAPNEHLLDIVKILPTLRVLGFDIKQTAAAAVQEPTLSCLLSLAEMCPDLTHIRLGSLFSSQEFCTTVPVKQYALEELLILDNRVETADLAKFIAELWPNASVLGARGSEDINIILAVVRHLRQFEAGENYLRL